MLGVLSAAVLLVTGCAPPAGGARSGGTEPQLSRSPATEASEAGDRKETLYYLRGTRLHRLDLESKRDAVVVVNLHSRDVFASQSSPWLAYIAPGTSSGETDPDFLERPTLHLFNIGTRRDITVGPGLGAVWGPGSEVAYLRPVEERDCSEESCRGRTKVVLRDADSGIEKVVLPAGHWSLLGWAGERVVVADAGHLRSTLLVGAEGPAERIPMAPSSLWGGSPDGRWLLTVDHGSTQFIPLEVDHTSAPPRISLSGGVLAEGSWSSDSTKVAAGLLDRRRLDSQLVVLRPESAQPRRIGSVRPAGAVLWSPSMSSIVAVVVDGSRGLRAVECASDGSSRCSTLFRWKRGVVLLSVG